MIVLRTVCYTLCSFLLVSTAAFRQKQKPAYPDSPEGLRQLMGDLVSAARANPARESYLIASLRLPDAPSWFADVFGTDNGAKLAASYQKSADLERYAKDLFGYCADEGVDEIQIEQLGTPGHPFFSDKVLASMIRPVPLYKVSFRTHGLERATSQNYVYVQEGFRRISDDVLIALPGMPQTVIRIAENAWQPKVKVKPRIPSDETGKPMHGKVLLHVLIDPKGGVKDVKLEKGDPVLGQAAAEAVRQWQFPPLTVAGNPVEVDTTITMRFP